MRDGGATAQEGLSARDEFGRPCGEIGQGPFADCVALAKRLAEQDGWGGVAVGDTFDIHEYI